MWPIKPLKSGTIDPSTGQKGEPGSRFDCKLPLLLGIDGPLRTHGPYINLKQQFTVLNQLLKQL